MQLFGSRGLISGRWNNLFRDHEIIVRTQGHVRYLRLSARAQRRAAGIAAFTLSAWAGGTAALLVWQAWASQQHRDVEARAAAVQVAEQRVAAERRSVEQIANGLDARQDRIETLFRAHFGEDEQAGAELGATDQPKAAAAQAAQQAAKGEVERLKQSGARQDQFIDTLTKATARRTAQAEQALLAVGIRPGDRRAQGGPFLPLARKRAAKLPGDVALNKLSAMLDRLEELESLLVALPSGRPADGMALTSGFGARSDPFTGARAMHAGLDFRGAHGSPIRSAAPGRVSFVGQRSGYGNVVEVDHGHGIMTRYAHLSGFAARIGQAVHTGDAIARMGSTGRSTGTHLHFEVRVNGTAVNPRRFLEANAHVLEVKADARERILGRTAAG